MQRNDDGSIAGEAREKCLIDGDTADDGERAPAEDERPGAGQREEFTLGAASRHKSHAAGAAEGRRQARLDAAMLVPEMT